MTTNKRSRVGEESGDVAPGNKAARSGEQGARRSNAPFAFVPEPTSTTAPRADAHALRSRASRQAVRRVSLRQRYFFELRQLRSEFGDWARREKAALERAIAANEDPEKRRRRFYTAEVTQFRRYAADLKSTYLRRRGGVRTFGAGDCAQLGLDADTLEASRPMPTRNLRDDATSIACGGLHNVAVLGNGDLYSWGCHDDGGLGVGDDVDGESFAPVRVTRLAPRRRAYVDPDAVVEPIRTCAAGDSHTLAVSDEGRVYFFGAYKDKEGKHWRDVSPPGWPLGPRDAKKEEERAGSAPKTPRGVQDYPAPVHLLGDVRVVAVACGDSFNAAITEDRDLLTWGMAECGELGRPTPDVKNNNGKYNMDVIQNILLKPSAPVWSVGSAHKISRVGCGSFHLLVVTSMMRVATAGLNQYGQLGLGDTNKRDVLTYVPALDGLRVREVDGGNHHSLCVDKDGRMLAFGRGDSGQLGNTTKMPPAGHFEASPVPVPLPGDDDTTAPPREKIAQISCGGNHNLALTESGDVYSWGYGDMCQLGHGKAKDEYRPLKIKVGNDDDEKIEVLQVCGGGQHSAILCRESAEP